MPTPCDLHDPGNEWLGPAAPAEDALTNLQDENSRLLSHNRDLKVKLNHALSVLEWNREERQRLMTKSDIARSFANAAFAQKELTLEALSHSNTELGELREKLTHPVRNFLNWILRR